MPRDDVGPGITDRLVGARGPTLAMANLLVAQPAADGGQGARSTAHVVGAVAQARPQVGDTAAPAGDRVGVVARWCPRSRTTSTLARTSDSSDAVGNTPRPAAYRSRAGRRPPVVAVVVQQQVGRDGVEPGVAEQVVRRSRGAQQTWTTTHRPGGRRRRPGPGRSGDRLVGGEPPEAAARRDHAAPPGARPVEPERDGRPREASAYVGDVVDRRQRRRLGEVAARAGVLRGAFSPRSSTAAASVQGPGRATVPSLGSASSQASRVSPVTSAPGTFRGPGRRRSASRWCNRSRGRGRRTQAASSPAGSGRDARRSGRCGTPSAAQVSATVNRLAPASGGIGKR